MSVNVKILKCSKKGLLSKPCRQWLTRDNHLGEKIPPEFKFYAVILRIIIMISPFFKTKKKNTLTQCLQVYEVACHQFSIQHSMGNLNTRIPGQPVKIRSARYLIACNSNCIIRQIQEPHICELYFVEHGVLICLCVLNIHSYSLALPFTGCCPRGYGRGSSVFCCLLVLVWNDTQKAIKLSFPFNTKITQKLCRTNKAW